MKIEICKRLFLKYSVSSVSSITTTFPSQGEYITPSFLSKILFGILKNQTEDRKRNIERGRIE
jgi:hypothetical protein